MTSMSYGKQFKILKIGANLLPFIMAGLMELLGGCEIMDEQTKVIEGVDKLNLISSDGGDIVWTKPAIIDGERWAELPAHNYEISEESYEQLREAGAYGTEYTR